MRILEPDPLKTAQDLCMHGIALSAQGKREESLTIYTKVIAEYSKRRSLGFLSVLATAMFNTGTTFAALGRDEEAVEAYDALIEKFDKQKHPALMLYIVKAMMNKAYRLNTLLKNEAAIATYRAVVKRFGGTKHLETKTLIDSVKAFLVDHDAVLEAREQASRIQSDKA